MKLNEQEREAHQKDSRKGQDAARILADPTLQAALHRLKEDAVQAWTDTLPSDTETREYLYNYIRAVARFTQDLLTAVEQGDYSQAILDRNY